MDYQAIYRKLMDRAKSRDIGGYTENHHILPKCLGGTNDKENIAVLTAREHYVAHQLLVKMHPAIRGLSFAAFMMAQKNLIGKHASRHYEWVKKRFIENHSKGQKGKKRSAHAMRGFDASRKLPKSDSHKAALSRANKGRVVPLDVRLKISKAHMGKTIPQSTRDKLSALAMGHKRGIGNKSRTGMFNSPETRRKIGLANLGKKKTESTKLAISKAQAKIPDDVVLAVRKEYEAGQVPLSSIAKRYGISNTHVHRIAKRKVYRWVA